jgi:hypothetical protein
MRRRHLALCLALLSTPVAIDAQRLDDLEYGTLLRVYLRTARDEPIHGTLQARDSTRIALLPAAQRTHLAVLRHDIARVQREATEADSIVVHRHGARNGFLVGLGITGLLVGAGAIADSRSDNYIPASLVALVGGGVITLVTTFAGSLTDNGKGPGWVEVPLRD